MKPTYQDALYREIGIFHGPIKKKSETSRRNLALVPGKATIRLEFFKCGKRCKKCSGSCNCNHNYHGPYFCAYWRDNGKLKKKYIREWKTDLESRLNTKGKRVGQWGPLSRVKKLLR